MKNKRREVINNNAKRKQYKKQCAKKKYEIKTRDSRTKWRNHP
jgi:hypothetical protein